MNELKDAIKEIEKIKDNGKREPDVEINNLNI